jgi:hypothetical protein
MSQEHGEFGIIEKMEPMARRALAQMEAMEKAIQHNNRDDVAKHLAEAQNALSKLSEDLELHDRLAKAFTINEADKIQKSAGNHYQFKNTDSDYDGTEGAVVLGVSRKGGSTNVFRPHQVF